MRVDCPLNKKNLERFAEDIKTIELIISLQVHIKNDFSNRNMDWSAYNRLQNKKEYKENVDSLLKNFDFSKSGNNYIVSINGIQIYEVSRKGKMYYYALFNDSNITGKSGFYDICQKMCGEDTLSKVKTATKGYTKDFYKFFDSYNDFSAFESYRFDEEEEEEEEEEDWDDGPVSNTVSKTELRNIIKDDVKTIKNKKFLDMVRYGQYDEEKNPDGLTEQDITDYIAKLSKIEKQDMGKTIEQNINAYNKSLTDEYQEKNKVKFEEQYEGIVKSTKEAVSKLKNQATML